MDYGTLATIVMTMIGAGVAGLEERILKALDRIEQKLDHKADRE